MLETAPDRSLALGAKLVGLSGGIILGMVLAYFLGRSSHAGEIAMLPPPPYRVDFRQEVFSPNGKLAFRVYPDASSTLYDEKAYYAIWSEKRSSDLVIIPKIKIASGRHPGQTQVFWEGNSAVHVLVPDGGLGKVQHSQPMKKAGVMVHFYRGHPNVLNPFREELLAKIHGSESRKAD